MISRPLQHEPGAQYAYSNFGYSLLGRVLEKISGISYEEYVKQHLLQPLGMKHTQLGKTLQEQCVFGEVTYYFNEKKFDGVVPPYVNKPVYAPYGKWSLEAMDAHGGWISSVVEMALFLTAFDDPQFCKLLKPESINRMFDPPQKGKIDDERYYAYGWSVRKLENGKFNAWHTGLLAGTSALMVRLDNGISWVVLFNASKPDAAHGNIIDPLFHKTLAKIKQWPDFDLFPEYINE